MIRVVTLAIVVALASAGGAQSERGEGVRISPADSSRLAMFRNPQVPVFSPGNTGLAFFAAPPALPAGNADPTGAWSCDGWAVGFADPRYTLRASDPDSPTSPSAYWQRVRGHALQAWSWGLVADYRITGELTDELVTSGPVPRSFASRLAEAWRDVPSPMISVDTDPGDPVLGELLPALRKALPRSLIGLMLDPSDSTATTLGRWDFFIVDPGDAPVPFRDQAAVSYWRARLGGRPVLFQLRKPDFAAGMFWIATGVAGLYFDDMPGPGSLEHRRDSMELRALSQFRMRFTDGTIRLMPELLAPGVDVAFGSPQFAARLLNSEAGGADIRFPGGSGGGEFFGFWYGPDHDETIAQPVRPIPPSGIMRVRKPDPTRWLYCTAARTQSKDSDTTTPWPRPDEP